ncbi:MAG: MarR family winged helix-turn-helix transcriptional regulator [Christensenellaceae bacterium]|jgi:DNA-binding MarR family transcriptional regulator
MNEDIREKLQNQILQLGNILYRRYNPWVNLKEGAHIHRGQTRLLRLLFMQDGISLKEVVEKLDIRPSSAGELAAKLEQASLITRKPDEKDKRIMRLYLTEAGREKAQGVASARDEMMGEIFSGLTEEEQQTLSTLLEKLIDSFRERMEACNVERPHCGGMEHMLSHMEDKLRHARPYMDEQAFMHMEERAKHFREHMKRHGHAGPPECGGHRPEETTDEQ